MLEKYKYYLQKEKKLSIIVEQCFRGSVGRATHS